MTRPVGNAASRPGARSPTADPRLPTRARAAFEALLIGLPAAALVALAWSRRWTTDDGFIALHVADNVLAGYGPVFNVSERVEAYTSPLWIGVLVLLGFASLPFTTSSRPPLELAALFAGLAGAGIGLLCAGLASRRLWRRVAPDALVLPYGAMTIAALPPFWEFTTSGLEGGLIYLWLAACFLGLTGLPSAPARAIGPDPLAVLFGLGPLVRPDLSLFSLAFLGTLLACTTGWRRRLAALGSAAALPIAYQVFRMGYFAALVPNTALAKEAGDANWARGVSYLWDFVAPYELWLPLAVLASSGAVFVARLARRGGRRELLVVGAAIAGAVLHALFVTRWGGDFLHARMLLPAYFAVVLPLASAPVRLFRWGAVVLVPWALACAFSLRVPYPNQGPTGVERGRPTYVGFARVPHPVTFRDYEAWYWAGDAVRLLERHPGDGARGSEHGVYVAEWNRVVERDAFQPWFRGDVVARRGAVGMFAFGGGRRIHVCDMYGIADPVGARLRRAGWTKSGHDKVVDTAWCLGWLLPHFEGVGGVALAAAQAALRCGDLRELQMSITSALDWSRFWRNVRLAPRLTALRIDPDPARARDELCGAGG